MHHRRGTRRQRYRGVAAAQRDRPGDRPCRAQPLLGGPVGQQGGLRLASRGREPPAGGGTGRGAVVAHHHLGALAAGYQGAGRPVDVDHHLAKAGQREHQRIVDLGQQPPGQLVGRAVPQRQDHRGLVPVGWTALRRKRQPEHRDRAAAPHQLLGERRDLRHQCVRVGTRPAHPAGAGDERWLVGDREYGGESDAEAPDRPGAVSRLADARSVDSASTPAASSGAPVLAATQLDPRAG